MCGILLWIERKAQALDVHALERASATLSHRGPDGHGLFVRDNVGLAHTRLSIVDIPGGDQPIFNEDRSIAVVCNGEIYNYRRLRNDLEKRGHRFWSGSDCEVITHLYEEAPDAYVEQLVGMFSFVLMDMRRGVLHVVRDRLGIKPLFVRITPEHILCASEIKALFAHPKIRPALDERAIWDFLTFGYTMGPRTAFEGIDAFPPGHLLRYELASDTYSFSEYWQPSFACEGGYGTSDVDEAARQFLELFTAVVADHTIGDIPVGVYMSGGIDSTAIAGILSGISPTPVTSLSLSFADRRFDESRYYREVVERHNLDSHVVSADECVFAEFERAIYHLEQPQIVSLDVANVRLSAFARARGIKSVLAGDGSDELLGGYDHFGAHRALLASMERRRRSGSGHDPELMASLSYLGFPDDFLRAFASAAREAGAVQERFGVWPPWYAIWSLNDVIKRGVMRDAWPSSLGPQSPLIRICAPLRGRLAGIDEANKAIFLELKTRLPNWILWKSDRDSMANSIEVRVPYLDTRVVEFLGSLPPKVKSELLEEKVILRRAFRDVLPDSILKRRKFAFNTPMAWVLNRSNRVEDLLSESGLRRTNLFDARAVAQLRAEVTSEKGCRTLIHSLKMQTLLGILTTQMLYEQYVLS